MFARDKRIGPYTYVYLVENVREEAGTDQRHPRAIDRQARDPSDRKGEIARRKDRRRSDPSCVPPDQGVR